MDDWCLLFARPLTASFLNCQLHLVDLTARLADCTPGAGHVIICSWTGVNCMLSTPLLILLFSIKFALSYKMC